MTRRRVRVRWIAVALVCAATTLAVAAPAGAYLRDFSAVQALTPTNSSSPKGLQLICPNGKLAIGAGATVSAFSNLGISRAWVLFGQRSVFGGAAETDSDPARWSLTDRAFCATSTPTKPPLGGAAAYVKQITIARNESGTNSNPVKTVTASCPAPLSPNSIGGGAAIEGATDVAVQSMQRIGTGFRVTARETDATNATWSVQAHAICANISTEINTANYVAPVGVAGLPSGVFGPDKSTAVNSLNKTDTVTCPPNTFIIGGGAQALGAGVGAPPPPAKVVLSTSRPAGDGPVANAWTATAREVDPTGAPWRLQLRAVCANFSGGPPA